VTTSLGALASEVRSGVERLNRLGELRAQIRQLAAIEKATNDLLAEFAHLGSVVAAARQAHFVPSMPGCEKEVSGLSCLLDQLAEGEVDREFAQGVIDAVRTLSQTLNLSVTAAWREHVVNRVPTQEGLLVLADAFVQVEGAGAEPARLKAALRTVHELLTKPPSAEALSELDVLAARIPELLGQLVGDDRDVRAFADQLAAGGAAVDKLTPIVLGWMNQKGFQSSFKVVAGRPAEVEPQ
jgi:hypothetical protein